MHSVASHQEDASRCDQLSQLAVKKSDLLTLNDRQWIFLVEGWVGGLFLPECFLRPVCQNNLSPTDLRNIPLACWLINVLPRCQVRGPMKSVWFFVFLLISFLFSSIGFLSPHPIKPLTVCSLFFKWTWGCKCSVHVSTCFQPTLCGQSLSNSISSDGLFWDKWRGSSFIRTMVPHVRDHPVFSPDKRPFFSPVEFQSTINSMILRF